MILVYWYLVGLFLSTLISVYDFLTFNKKFRVTVSNVLDFFVYSLLGPLLLIGIINFAYKKYGKTVLFSNKEQDSGKNS